MRRALMEYEVRGIRTSLPFFHWMLGQPAFLAAEFHTEFLDELLQRRGGKGFSDVDPSLEEVAAIAACIAGAADVGPVVAAAKTTADTWDRQTFSGPPVRTWKGRARREGLRG
jgi:acetyl-CoA carboxylase biotin carboxylase subunit